MPRGEGEQYGTCTECARARLSENNDGRKEVGQKEKLAKTLPPKGRKKHVREGVPNSQSIFGNKLKKKVTDHGGEKKKGS